MIIKYFIVKLFLRSLFLTLISPKDIMFFKVITATLITICAADNRKLLTELDSKQEHPALLFNGDVLFPNLRSILRPIRSADTNTFQKLQYAPLHDGVSQKSKNADEEYTKLTPTPSSAPSEPIEFFPDKKSTQLYAKSHLEPRPEATDTKCYVPGFNVETSASRSPGHNAVYRIIPEVIELEKPVKISEYVKPIGINLKLESLPTTTKPSLNLASEHVDKPLTLSNDHFVINPAIIETVVQDKSKRYTPHTKYHRIHLNIARVYSPGQLPPKPAVFPNIYPDNYGRRHSYPKVYAPQAYPDLKMNTVLYPVSQQRKGYRFRTSIIHL